MNPHGVGGSTLGAVMMGSPGVPGMARRLAQGMALVRKVPRTGHQMKVRVISVEGDCAWGYHEVDRWSIDPNGWVTPNLCQAAAAAVSARGPRLQEAQVDERLVSCRCPMPGRKVTFGVSADPALSQGERRT